MPLTETSPLRNRLYPYRAQAKTPEQMEYWYDKIEAERIFQQPAQSERVILRLPKVYGATTSRCLETVYCFADQPDWRWTHGHVDNVGAAIALAATHPDAAGEVLNLGEETTPSMGERLAYLPTNTEIKPIQGDYDFRHSIDCDTSKIRQILGWKDVVDEKATMIELAR
jgi:nucleoside-diphosphate-sugar epimerase